MILWVDKGEKWFFARERHRVKSGSSKYWKVKIIFQGRKSRGKHIMVSAKGVQNARIIPPPTA